jgi:anti-sigma regulatory factor (Ser/Thr protein kinase)
MNAHEKSKEIRQYILESVGRRESDLSAVTAQKFKISRQAVNGHLRKLIADGLLTRNGITKGATYALVQEEIVNLKLSISDIRDEHIVWRDRVQNQLKHVSAGSIEVWEFAFTEMLNNVISHSEGMHVWIRAWQSSLGAVVRIDDDGVGIFSKLQVGLGLAQKHDAVVELMKGGTTTDRANHTGLGIFYSSQIMDLFLIRSEHLIFVRTPDSQDLADDTLFMPNEGRPGTSVLMLLANTKDDHFLRDFFEKLAPDVESSQPMIGSLALHLVEENGSPLVSRSQAKMLMARMDVYKTIVFDFAGIDFIGQAFADQIFRVFAREHPQIELVTKNEGNPVKKMIRMAQNALLAELASGPL